MSAIVQNFKHVSYLWDEATAAAMAGDEVALLVYRSNLLGADLRLTNYGGGNTSCKAVTKDPLTGNGNQSDVGERKWWRPGNDEAKRTGGLVCRQVTQQECIPWS